MCGIAGLALAANAPAPDPNLIARMSQALAHRGPDGSGHTVVGKVALIHTRLSIIDVNGGDQPLFAGSASLIGNGEIYNYRELREQTPGVTYATNSDCEVPLHLWLKQGVSYAETLRGMYALGIHERANRSLTLSRDPFGIKPLYTAAIQGEHGAGLAFASEPRVLLDSGLVPRGVRKAARHELLQMQFTTGAETIFPGITRVLPGETLVVADGKIIDRRRIDALPEGRLETISEEDALARLDRAIMDSVAMHQRSDVGYGLFLSGGVDSAAILAAMQRLNEQPVRAFTAGFAVPGAADERERASRLAKKTGALHETIEVTEAMVWRHLPEIVACMDDPAADYAIIPSWFLARHARQSVKVVLCGEGGDEIFAGYGRYRSAMRPWWLGGKLMRGRGTFDGLGVLRRDPTGWRDGLAAVEGAVGNNFGSRLAGAQAVDCADWLPHDLLLKLDRCLMAHGIEGRTPFLDPVIAEAGFRLPDDLKVRDRRGKYLLRRWLQNALPESDPFAAKQGFTVPVGAWIAEAATRLGPLVASRPCIAELAEPDRVISLFRHADERHKGFAAWTLLFYALWHRAHVEGVAPGAGESVYDALSA